MVYDKVIEGYGVNLRAVEPEDAEFTYYLRQDKDRTRYIHSVQGTIEDQRNWILKQRQRPGDYYFIVEDKEGKPLGTAGYYDLKGKNGETGRLIVNGTYAQNCDAILQLRHFAFDIIGADYVRCTVVEGNKPVIAQLKRFGGVYKESFIDPKDGFVVLVYHVSREDYKKKAEKYDVLVRKSFQL